MQPHLRTDKMFLIGIWVETLFYGLNCGLFVAALYVLTSKSARRDRSWWLIAVSAFLFSLSTAYVAISLRQLLEAFIYAPPGTATRYFASSAQPLAQTKLILYPLNVVTQNLFLIWRLWAVWGRDCRIIVLPIVLQATQTVAAYVSLSITRSHSVETPLVRKLGLLNWAMDLIINVGVTALIAYRLRSMGRSVRVLGSSEKEYYGVMRMVIESGVLSSTATLIAVSIFLSRSDVIVTAIDSLVQLATITPLFIIVRVGLGLAGHPTKNDHSSNSNDTKIEFTHPDPHEIRLSMGDLSS